MDEIRRLTYWNIPLLLEVLVYPLAAVVAVIFIWNVRRRMLDWTGGKLSLKTFTWDHLDKRIGSLLLYALGQWRVMAEIRPGLVHLGIFAGICLLFVGTALATLDWDVTHLLFGFQFLTDGFYLVYKLVLDLAGFVLALGLLIAAIRRYVQKPPRLNGYSRQKYLWDDTYTLGIVAVIMLSGFMIGSLRTAVLRPAWAPTWTPVTYTISLIWGGLDPAVLQGLHVGTWLFHMLLAFVAIATLPMTKLWHTFTAFLNVFFRRLQPVGAIPAIANIEEQESFGISQRAEFSWKQRLDFDACTRCGRCQEACPAHGVGTPLSPKNLIVKLYGYMLEAPVKDKEGKLVDPRPLHAEVIAAEELWACTTCRACSQACPVFIDQVETIIDLRRYLTLSEGAIPTAGANALKQIERQGNPFGIAKANRWSWAADLNLPRLKPDEEVEYLYWVGCSAAFDTRNQKIARAMVKVLRAAGVSFGVMAEERCHAEGARRMGEEYLYQNAAQENIANFGKYRFKKILTHCPHCYNTFKNEYPQFGGNYPVVHHTTLVAELLASGRIKPVRSLNQTVTYHDSCYLGRYNGIYDPQRQALRAIPGLTLVEMGRARENGLCCGGGGGQMWLETAGKDGVRMNQRRLDDVLAVKADTVAVACPFCLTMFDDAIKVKGLDEKMGRKDIVELVAESLE